jgi:hypothetical protein
MTNKASSFPAASSIGPLHRHGGRIAALGELPIHAAPPLLIRRSEQDSS